MITKLSQKAAFTLAEVLITLGIIGVVAAMTIPTLMNKTQDMEFKTAYKKAYAITSQVVLQCNGDDTFVERTGWTDATNNLTNFNAFMEKFKVVKYCDGTTILLSECWDMNGEKFNGGASPLDSTPGFVDSSGVVWVHGCSGTTRTGDVFMDTNGFKPPNKFGKDRFRLYFSPANSDVTTPGLPSKILTDIDYPSYDGNFCKYPPCYNRKWIIN